MGAYIFMSDVQRLSAKGQGGQVFSRYTCFKYPYFSSEMNSFVSTVKKTETTPIIKTTSVKNITGFGNCEVSKSIS